LSEKQQRKKYQLKTASLKQPKDENGLLPKNINQKAR